MKTWTVLFLAAAAAGLLISTACEPLLPGNRYQGPWVPDISGDWNGEFYYYEYGEEMRFAS